MAELKGTVAAEGTIKGKLHTGLAISIDDIVKKVLSQVNIIATVTLYADKWEGAVSPYSQVVDISGIPAYYTGTVRLTPEQAEAFRGKDVAFMVGNKNGIITVYCIGQKLVGDYDVEIKFEKEERI